MTSMPMRRACALAVVLGAATLGGSCSPSGGGDAICQGSDCPGNLLDRTPPRVTSLVPADGAANVWARDPITITFSEPIDPTSITAETLVLADRLASPIEHVASLSADGETLTVRTVGLSAVPDVLHAALGGLRDRAGNVLAGSPVAWQWEVPDWQDLASPIGRWTRYGFVTRMAVDGRGRPTLLLLPALNASPGVSRWDGSAWSLLPAPAVGAVVEWSTAFDGDAEGRLAFVFGVRSADPNLLYAAVWDGATWSEPAVLNVDATQLATAPAVRMREDGTAVAAWFEAGSVQARRWNGTAWTRLGGALPGDFGKLDVSFDEDGSPRVTGVTPGSMTASYSESTDTWTLTWSLHDGLAMRANAAGEVFAMSLETSMSPAQLQVDRYSPLAQGWYRLGGALNATPDQAPTSPELRIDPSGNPIVAWVEGNEVHVARWDGDLWQPLGADVDGGVDLQQVRDLQIAVGAGGTVAALWYGMTSPESALPEMWVLAKRFNR